MKKTLTFILSLILIAAFTTSCATAPDNSAGEEVVAKLGDTGYSMILTGDFERSSFFDIKGEDAPDNIYGIYENDKSCVIVYAGKADNTLDEELEILLDEITTWDAYAAGKMNRVDKFTTTGYESAGFDADIEWEDGKKENVKVLIIKCGENGAVVYYFIPQGDEGEAQKRDTILSGELIKE